MLIFISMYVIRVSDGGTGVRSLMRGMTTLPPGSTQTAAFNGQRQGQKTPS